MAVLLSILGEAADRYEFSNPGARVGRLKVPRKDIQPFSLSETLQIIREGAAGLSAVLHGPLLHRNAHRRSP
jgi:hypothetical protein